MSTISKNILISVVGPTAIGKTALSIKLANHFNADIISCDSRQFYREMTIGTAVPNTDELASAKHHFIQSRSIFDSYSVGQFEREALKKLDELFLKNPIQIMVGGSGLYIDAVLKGLDEFPEVDSQIRSDLILQLDKEGIESLQNKLKELDIETYKTIEISNPHRLLRALEICIGSGIPYSTFKNKPKKHRNFISLKIGITADRELIYNRINERVDCMIENGLLEEAKNLHLNKNLNALKTVGYRELFSFFDEKFTKEFAISEIKKNTRRYAKRQITWFKKDEEIIWFDYQTDSDKIILELSDIINAI